MVINEYVETPIKQEEITLIHNEIVTQQENNEKVDFSS